jgi:hypothetical protein
MKMKNVEKEKTKSMASLAAKVVFTGALLAGCSPNVNIHNKFYDPYAPDAGCTAISSCSSKSVLLREKGNTAGSSEAKAWGLSVRLASLSDVGATKAATLEFEGCQEKAQGTFTPGSSSAITLGRDSFSVKLDSVEYDGSGLKVSLTITPACPADGSVAKDSSQKSG